MANIETPEDLNRIVTRSQEFIETINDVFTSNGISLPARQYVTVGPIEETTHDFHGSEGQLTISFGNLRLGITPNSTGAIRGGCVENYIATFFIELVRCTPQPVGGGNSKNYGATNSKYTNTAPKEDKMNSYGEQRMRDVWLLLRSVQNMRGNHSTLHDLATNIVPGKEDGGVQAIRLTVEVLV